MFDGWRSLLWWRPPIVLRSVTVNLVHDPTAIHCVLWRVRGPWLVLRGARLLRPPAAPQRVEGDVIVHRSQVLFIEVDP